MRVGGGFWGYTLLNCTAVKRFRKDSSHQYAFPCLPSMHCSPGPMGPLCDPLLRKRERERRGGGVRGGGVVRKKKKEGKMSACVMFDRNGANLSPGG